MAKRDIDCTPDNTDRTPVERILRPFQRFAKIEAAGGILLLVSTIVALAWANSPWGESYHRLWEAELWIGLGEFGLVKPLHLWINDGLMAVFFFLVGLEIKREMLVGELASPRKAALPLFAALGGMVVPAAIYIALNAGQAGARGWGIPMATDIAFALGVLALLGRRVPLVLKVFLAALAIVDDIGAVLVIALFYTAEISWFSLAVGGGFLIALMVANRLGSRSLGVYVLLGIGLWVAFLKSGVHATVAGVLLAMTIPARTRIEPERFLDRGRSVLDRFEGAIEPGRENSLINARQQAAVQALETAAEQVQAPLQRLEHSLHSWVAFGIMPLFAFSNAGVVLAGNVSSALTQPVFLGVVTGLVFGKQLGILFFTWLSVRVGLAVLPVGVTWRHIHGIAWLGGIGFTMSLFIANLAFADPLLLLLAKLAILTASLISGIGGWLWLRNAGVASENEDSDGMDPVNA